MACAPNESCGFVMKDGTYQLCRNVSQDPQNSFAMHHDDVMAYLDDAAAYVHSECYTSEDIDKSDGVDLVGHIRSGHGASMGHGNPAWGLQSLGWVGKPTVLLWG